MPFLVPIHCMCAPKRSQAEVVELSQTKCLQMGVFSFFFSLFFITHQTGCQRPVTDAALIIHPTLLGFLSIVCFFLL